MNRGLPGLFWGNMLLLIMFLFFLIFRSILLFVSFPPTYKQLLIFPTVCESESEIVQSCLTLCRPHAPGSSVHGILQARVLEWVAISFSRGSSQPRDQTQVSHLAGSPFTLWATREDIYIHIYILYAIYIKQNYFSHIILLYFYFTVKVFESLYWLSQVLTCHL